MTARAYSRRITEVERLVAETEQAKPSSAEDGWLALAEHFTSRELEALHAMLLSEDAGSPPSRAHVLTVHAAVERSVVEADSYHATVAAEEWRAFFRDWSAYNEETDE